MSDEPVVWKPQILKPRLRVVKLPCAACGKGHAQWWKSTPPPSHGSAA